MRNQCIDEMIEGPAAEDFGREAMGLEVIVFLFGFFLLYLLILF